MNSFFPSSEVPIPGISLAALSMKRIGHTIINCPVLQEFLKISHGGGSTNISQKSTIF